MSGHAWLTLLLIVTAIYALATDRLPTAVVVLGTNVLLLVFGVIGPAEALSGFANPAPVTVAALFILARAVEKTGALQPMLETALGHSDPGRRGLLRLLAPVTVSSAFLNNTPIVAMLAPPVAQWAEKRGLSPSSYLMPLSFATILGGTITLIGTSTNLVVSGLMPAAGMQPLGMFELTPIGLPVAAAGLGVLVLLAPRVLPVRRSARQEFERTREFVYQTVVDRGGPYDGRSVEQAGLRNLQGVFLVEVERNGHVIAPATPATVLTGGDCLTFAGRVDMIRDLQARRGLRAVEHAHAVSFAKPGHTFFEAVVGGASDLAGKTLRDVEFRNRYQAAVLAIHRSGQRVNEKLGTVPMREGDTLLLVSDGGFSNRWRDHNDFALVAELGGSMPVSGREAIVVAAIALGVVFVAGLGLLPILQASLIGSMLLLLTRIVTPGEARHAVEIDLLVTIAASFGIGAAIQKSGLAATLGGGIIAAAGQFGPTGVLLAVILATIAVTELITNNAAAVLLFPIAVAAAHSLGVDARPFAIAVAISASLSFLTPIGYQTNTMVYGLGGYRFGDFARLGLPLTIMSIVLLVLLIPVFWPF
ncbi:MAG: SLC13 family permease [Gemmatimonadota bacterium]